MGAPFHTWNNVQTLFQLKISPNSFFSYLLKIPNYPIVSGCGGTRAPAVYSEVATVLDWINNVTDGCNAVQCWGDTEYFEGTSQFFATSPTCVSKGVYQFQAWMWQFIADLTADYFN